MKLFKRSFTFDFGTANTVVCKNGQVVFDEPTLVSVWPDGLVEVGQEARRLLYGERMGCLGGPIGHANKYVWPISGGYVADCDAFASYVKGVFKRLSRFPRLCSVLIAIPDDFSVDGSTFCAPFYEMGIKDVRFINQSVAASVGLGLPSDKYHLIVDCGFGKIRASLVKDSRIVKTKQWCNVSGNTWISDIQACIRSQHQLKTGRVTAEWLLVSVGAASVDISDIPEPCSVTGPNLMTAHPVTVTLDHKDLAKVLDSSLSSFEKELDDFMKEEIMTISEDVSRDIVSDGVWLIGGGSRLRGLSERLKSSLNLQVHTTADPFAVISKGASSK